MTPEEFSKLTIRDLITLLLQREDITVKEQKLLIDHKHTVECCLGIDIISDLENLFYLGRKYLVKPTHREHSNWPKPSKIGCHFDE